MRHRDVHVPQGDAAGSATGRRRRSWRARGGGGQAPPVPGTRRRGGRRDAGARPPDGQKEALIWNYNITVRDAATKKNETLLSTDGSEGNAYEFGSIVWSPDSKKIAAYRVKPGYRREVHYVESSPEDQLQPKYSVNVYAKPGDALAFQQPVLFDVASKKQTDGRTTRCSRIRTESARFQWRKDSRARSRSSTTSAGIRCTA